MKSQIESLQESRDFWAESAKHDRKQFFTSFLIAATGVGIVGVGVKTAFNGDIPGGITEVVVGGGIATSFGKLGLSEIQDFADMTAQSAIRQNQIDELTK